MKFNDDITQSIAATVQNVLEGKPAVKKEEVKYPHMMYDPKTGKGVEVKNKDEHDKYNKMGWGHEKPKNLDEVEEPNVPSKDANMGSKKGEAEFKKLHKGKKVGEKEDGTVVKEETLLEALNERKLLKVARDLEKMISKTGDLLREITQHEELELMGESYGELGKGQEMMDYGIRYLESDLKDYFEKNEQVKEHTITLDEAKIDVDYIGDKDLSKKLEKKFKIKIKDTGQTTADVSGTKANLIKFLKSDAYLMDDDEINDTFPELKEGKEVDEESAKQAAYKKVFNAGLKKFGVNGIGELDDEKKKQFFNWVDKNYEAKAEELDSKKVDDEEEVNEGKIKVTAFTGNDPDTMEGESYKKYGLKLKKVGSSYGYDDVELSGPDAKVIKFAQRNLGVSGKNIRAIQKELDNM